MNDGNTKALKSGIWYTISNFAVKGLVFFTTPIFTRMLTTEEFGDYSNYTSWLSILAVIVTLNFESTFISAKYDYQNKIDKYCYSVLSLSSLSSIAWIILICTFSKFFEDFFNLDKSYLLIMLVYILFLAVVNMFQVYQRYTYKYKLSVVISFSIAFFSTLLSIFLVLSMEDRLTGRIIGSAVPTIVIGIIIYLYLSRKAQGIDFSTWKYALVICLPYIPHLLSLNLLNSMDRTMIRDMCGSEETAIYSVAYTCGTIITILLQSVNTAFAPWLGDKLNIKQYDVIRKVAYKYIAGAAVFSIGIMILSPEVLFILGGKKYMDSIYVLAPVSMGSFCQFLYTMFVNVEQFCKKTMGMAFASISAAVLNYSLNAIFIPKYGYYVAAYTTLISFVWLLLVHMYLVKRIGYSVVYNYKFIFFIVIMMGIITVGMNYLYSFVFLRYMLMVVYIIVISIILLKYRHKLIRR